MIVEDEPLARHLLEEYISKIPSLNLLHSSSNPLEALEALEKTPPDILFLDVQMPEITGITLLKVLKKKPHVILTTAYSEYAIESYELDVADYLLKPITLERFLKSIEKIKLRISQNTKIESSPTESKEIKESGELQAGPKFFFAKDGNKHIKINFDEIMYIEGLKDYVRIHTPQQKVTTLQKLKVLEDLLPSERFIRIHNSYIVCVDWIDVIQRESVQIGNAVIPISDTYRKAFKEFVEKRELN